jgi:hypothetical protein
LPALPGLLLGALTSLLRRPPATPPDTAFTARFRLSGIDPAQLAGYRDFFDYRLPGVPLSYFYLPAQRAQLALMLDKRFPYPLPGLIHSGNVLRLHAIPQAASALEIDVLTRLCHRPDEAPKIVCEVAFSQSGRPVASCTSDYRIAAKRRPKRAEPGEPEDFPESIRQRSGATPGSPGTTTRSTCPRCWPGCSGAGAPLPTACIRSGARPPISNTRLPGR